MELQKENEVPQNKNTIEKDINGIAYSFYTFHKIFNLKTLSMNQLS